MKGTKYSDQQIMAIIRTNLAISYYKIGFYNKLKNNLIQFYQCNFIVKLSLKDLGLALKNQTIKMPTNIIKTCQKIKYDMLITKI